MYRSIIDFGSRSAKLYRRGSQSVTIVRTVSYDLISKELSVSEIEKVLDFLLDQEDGGTQRVAAIATEAARRSPDLASKLAVVCKARGVSYSTVSQAEEAELISRAFVAGSYKDCEIINAGGGSIQIVRPNGDMHLIPFGISDLNKRFSLDGAPESRQFKACRDFLLEHFPCDFSKFVYTGGEEAYLRHFGIALGEDGSCRREDFFSLSQYILTKSLEELNALSPYGDNWMTGAIGSHAIVEAALIASGQGEFFPSDLNIAHGLIGAVMRAA